jgi:cytochrome c553
VTSHRIALHPLRIAIALPLLATPAVHAADAARGGQIAVECQACHGPDGNSPSPLFPRLAGQHAEYLVIAMQSYRDGRRTDPIMRAAIQNVQEGDLADLAEWFATQKPATGTQAGTADRSAALAAAGQSVGPVGTAPASTGVLASAPTSGCPDPKASPTRDRDGDGVADADDAAPRDRDEFAKDADGDGFHEICTAGQLQAIRTLGTAPGSRTALTLDQRMARNYEIVADLDLAGISNWQPIGDCGPEQSCMKAGDKYGFAGQVEGHGHAVRGLRIDRPEAGGVGLFGVVKKTGVITNIRVIDARVRAGNGAGALVGANFGTVSNAEAIGSDVYAKAAVGALVGGSAGTVIRGRATGKVGGEAALGGVIGDMRGVVTDSWADVAVSGTKGAGGLVGLNTFGRVLNSYATGPVSAVDNAGGLVGMNTDAVVENSYATGAVSGTGTNTGGLVGFNSLSKVRGSYATGAVTGKAAAGSLVGRNAGEVSQSYAAGPVNGAAGLLVGDGSAGAVVP